MPDYFDVIKSRAVILLKGGTGTGEYRQKVIRQNEDWCAAYLATPVELPDELQVGVEWMGQAIGSDLGDLRLLCVAYNTEGSKWYRDAGVLRRIIGQLDVLLNYYESHHERPRPGNWFYWMIPNPEALGAIGLLMEAHFPASLTGRICAVMADSLGKDMVLSGANASWEARNHVFLALLTGDEGRLKSASLHVFVDLRYTTDSGLREDYGYLFHGRIPYAGGYGAGLVQTASQFMFLFDKTPLAASSEKRELIAKFLIEHTRWFLEGSQADMLISGRGYAETGVVSERGYAEAGAVALITEAMLLMSHVDTPMREQIVSSAASLIVAGAPVKFAVAELADRIAGQPVSRPTGFRYWHSCEMGVYKGKRFHVGFRQFSSRVQDYEFLTMKGGEGWDLAMGFTNVLLPDGKGSWYRDGNMLDHVDMKHLPGVTSRAGSHPVNPITDISERGFSLNFGRSHFAGGAGSECGGVAGFIHEPVFGDFVARKSLHFFPEGFWALGSGITVNSKARSIYGSVYTTVLQWQTSEDNPRLLLSDGGERVLTGSEDVELAGLSWILTDGMAVIFPSPVKLFVRKNGGMVTAWLDHGISPVGEEYAYAVLPDVTEEKVRAFSAQLPVRPVRVDTQMHAVQDTRNGSMGWVFFEGGENEGVCVDGPAIVYRQQDADGGIYSIQNPLHDSRDLYLKAPITGVVTLPDSEVRIVELKDDFSVWKIDSELGRIYKLGFGLSGEKAVSIPREELGDFYAFHVEAESNSHETVLTVRFPDGIIDQPHNLVLQGSRGHNLLSLENGERIGTNTLRYIWLRTPPEKKTKAQKWQFQVAGDFRVSLLTESIMTTRYITIPAFDKDGRIDTDLVLDRDSSNPHSR